MAIRETVIAYLKRRKAEEKKKVYHDNLRVITEIEGGNVCKVRRLSEDHFSLQMKSDIPSIYKYPNHHGYWFYFKLEGAEGREIKIDIANCDWMTGHWKKYRPVYSYADDPDSLSDDKWYRIDQTRLKQRTFSFSQKFQKNHAWIALRYPYNYSRLKNYIDSVQGNEYTVIEQLGSTAMGNTLFMFSITDRNIPRNKKKGILVYAREHGVEQDGSWVAEGMMDFLTSKEPVADILRRKFNIMIVPIISPDAVITGRVVDRGTGISPGDEGFMADAGKSIEAKLLYNRVARSVRAGNSLDLCISLHNPHGTEPNIYPHYRPYKNSVLLIKAKRLHRAVLKNASGYTSWREFTKKVSPYSVGSFARDFGSIAILYEVNHQAKDNFLSIRQLKGLGEVILKGVSEYYGLN